MSRPRNGRIARLPRPIREELNQRLDEGESGQSLVAWLNSLPEVVALAHADHGGKPLREQHLSEWRKGGFRDWQIRQEAIEIAERLGEDVASWRADDRPALSDGLAHWIAARYALATREIASTPGEEGWRLLRELCHDLVDLRRGDHSAERLRLDRERLAIDRERERQRTAEELIAWAMEPENRERICKGYQAPAETIARLREMMFGKAPDTKTNARDDG